jgi:hypothetical protein
MTTARARELDSWTTMLPVGRWNEALSRAAE